MSEEIKSKIIANEANIPALTEVLPLEISNHINSGDFQEAVVQTTTLSLDAPAGSMHRKACDTFRGGVGRFRGIWGSWRRAGGFVSQTNDTKTVIE